MSRSVELARKINRLFTVMHKRADPPVPTYVVSEAISARGGAEVSVDLLERMRNGEDVAVTEEQLRAIAEYFGVAAHYLCTTTSTADIDWQLNVLCALRDAGVGAAEIRAGFSCTRGSS